MQSVIDVNRVVSLEMRLLAYPGGAQCRPRVLLRGRQTEVGEGSKVMKGQRFE